MMGYCDICREYVEKELMHLPLYVCGSEGIVVCLHCRIKLTEFARLLQEQTRKSEIRVRKEYARKRKEG